MTTKTTNKFSTEMRERAVRMVLEHVGDYLTRWAAVESIAAKIGCAASPPISFSPTWLTA